MTFQDPATQLTPDQIAEVIDRHGMGWVDQFNQHLQLTVRALHTLHSAFDSKFPRHGHVSGGL
jgi:hypothetical protein